jgi:alanine dehydrogenase
MALLLSRKDVESVLGMDDCMRVVEAAFGELARGTSILPQRAVIRVADHKGLFLGMPAYIGGDTDALGMKLVTVYPDNPVKKNLPTILGTLLLCDSTTGQVVSVMDAGYLTAVRTGAASGVATRLLAREDSKTCVIFGAGGQARKQLEACNLVRPFEKVFVIDINHDLRDAFAGEMAKLLGCECVPTDDTKSAVEQSDMIITASSSHDPVFDGEWIRPGTHINNIGSHTPDARELDTTTVKRSKFVADLKEANLAEAGDLLIPIAEGAVTEDHVYANLGDLVTGEKPGRESAEEITLFKSCGLAVQDVATATVVFKSALKKGVGTHFEF